MGATASPTDQDARAPAGTWRIDPVHSSVAFEVKHLMMSTIRGHFAEFEGEIVTDGEPSRATARATCRAASVDTGNALRDAALRGADFFDAGRFPVMSLETTHVETVVGRTYRVGVRLTIRGRTLEREVEATVEGFGPDPWGAMRAGIAIRGEIDRTDFGLLFNQVLGPAGPQPVRGGSVSGALIGEKVGVRIDVSAVLE